MSLKPKLPERYYNGVQAVLSDIEELHKHVAHSKSDKPVEEFQFNCYIPGVLNVGQLKTYTAQMMNYAMGLNVVSLDIKLQYGNMFIVSAAIIRPVGHIGDSSLEGKVDKI